MGLSRPLRALLANMPLRGCVGRTGFESPYPRPGHKTGPDGAVSFLAVWRVLCAGCSGSRGNAFPVLLEIPGNHFIPGFLDEDFTINEYPAMEAHVEIFRIAPEVDGLFKFENPILQLLR